MLDKIWIIPALPALSFVLILAIGKKTPGKGHFIGIPIVGIAFILSLVTAGQWLNRDTTHDAKAALSDVPVECAAAVHEVAGHEGDSHSGEDHSSGEQALGTETNTAPSNHGASRGVVSAAEGEETHNTRPVVSCVHWFNSGGIDIKAGTIADGQSILMLVVVTLVSLLVHIFSTDYVAGDRRYTHYFAFLSLFTASMLFFVMSDNVLQMIVGWELVGVCSFALIGHWWEDKPNSDAALKAFLTNRVGDVGLLVGMIMLYFAAGQSFSVLDINALANSGGIGHSTLLIASCCLIAAVMSKSGQFILHTWLPDAMAGPTPVSALIHAATMVVAGIYMVARLYPVFFHGLSISGGSFNVLALVGSVTALFGALLGFVQSDIKKTLAYSTVSQLGFMVAALGVGAWTAALFHLFTHALFKACLFLGAGSLSHACHHSFNMVDDMGGLRKIMPRTFWTYVLGTGALAGVFPLAGFWSKDEILAGTGAMNDANGQYYFVLIMLLAAAFCTAAYMTRTIWYAFFGEFRGHGHPHESGPRITIPLMILAGGAVLAGFANLPSKIFAELPTSIALRFEHAVEPVGVFFPGHAQGFTHAEFNPTVAGISLLVGLSGIAVTWVYYSKGAFGFLHGLSERNKLAGLGKKILVNKYYLDWLYTDVICGFVKGALARATNWVNTYVIDGVVNGAGRTAVGVGQFVYNKIDQGGVDGLVNGLAGVAGASGGELRKMQTGRVQQYASLFFAAAALLAGIVVIIVGG